MGYLILEIIFFLALACALGFAIGWFLRGSRFEGQIHDLDARWRTKLSETESERDRFATEINQANEAKSRLEASEAEARRLADTHESSLQQLRNEHQNKLGLLSEVEGRASGLEQELADAKASLANFEGGSGDAARMGGDLADAKARVATLERDLKAAKDANGACKRDVDRLQAEVAALRGSSSENTGGGALGLTGPTGSSTSSDDHADSTSASTSKAWTSSGPSESAGGAASGSGSAPLGLVGGTDTTHGEGSTGSGTSGGEAGTARGRNEPGFVQRAASPSGLAEVGGQGLTGAGAKGTSQADEENEGVRPEALTEPRTGGPDNLKKISGVGPKLEKTLHGLGIFHFSQIADFTRDNVAWVDRHLRFKGRIDRENWIEQAKILAAGGETEFSKRKK